MVVLLRLMSFAAHAVAALAACIAGFVFLFDLAGAASAPQQAALAATVLAFGLLPYAAARSSSEALRDVAALVEREERLRPAPEHRIARGRGADLVLLAVVMGGAAVAFGWLAIRLANVEPSPARSSWAYSTMVAGGASYAVATTTDGNGAELLVGATDPPSVVVQFPGPVACDPSCTVTVSIDGASRLVSATPTDKPGRVFIRDGAEIADMLTAPSGSSAAFAVGEQSARFVLDAPVSLQR